MDKGEFDRRLLDRAIRQCGAVAVAQVTRNRAEYHRLHRRALGGVLDARTRGVFVHRGFPPSWRQDLWVAHLAAGCDSAVAARSAARLHGVRTFEDDPAVEVLTRWCGSHRVPVGVVHETFWLPPEHKTTIDGLPVTTLARTVFDLAGLPRNPMAFRNDVLREIHVKRTTWLVNAAIRDHGMRMADLVQVLAAVGRRGKPGTSIIRDVVADLGTDYVPSASELEDTFLGLVRAAGLPEPDREVNAGTRDRWVGRVDFRWRGRRVIAEIDGSQHNAPLERRSDRARDQSFTDDGWTVLRFTWWQIVFEPEAVIEALTAVLAA